MNKHLNQSQTFALIWAHSQTHTQRKIYTYYHTSKYVTTTSFTLTFMYSHKQTTEGEREREKYYIRRCNKFIHTDKCLVQPTVTARTNYNRTTAAPVSPPLLHRVFTTLSTTAARNLTMRTVNKNKPLQSRQRMRHDLVALFLFYALASASIS